MHKGIWQNMEVAIKQVETESEVRICDSSDVTNNINFVNNYFLKVLVCMRRVC